jgi:hypothetical protein
MLMVSICAKTELALCGKNGVYPMSDDNELLREVNRRADQAEAMRPARLDRYALAVTLAGSFQHRSREEIEKMITDVWRERGLGWQSTKRREQK